jgi:chitosanase
MLTGLQKATAQAIVNIFETGSALGDYANVTLIPGDPGHLTYGRSQTTLASGNLFLLIRQYCQAANAEFADALRPFLDRLDAHDLSLDQNTTLRQTLRQAGADPVMHTVQDAFFDRVYWTPAVASADAIGVASPLGVATVYDSTVHGSWKIVRDKTIERFGNVASLGEDAWIAHYVQVRRDWLANHPKPVLHATVYRMDALQKLISAGNWMLQLPITVRGILIDPHALSGSASAHDPDERLLKLTTPHLQGEDVRALQQALMNAGITVGVDGDFGKQTQAAVEKFQHDHGLTVDGIVGAATRSALHMH